MKKQTEEEKRIEQRKRASDRLDLLHTLNDMDARGNFSPSMVCDAIVSGMLPHVEFKN